MQRGILAALAKQALDPEKPGLHAYEIQDAHELDDGYEVEDAILLEGGWVDLYVALGIEMGDLARSSSARRAVRLLVERGLLEVSVSIAKTGYRRAGEGFVTQRWSTHIRLPPMRFDPDVAEGKGSVIAEHCRGIADVLVRPRQLEMQRRREFIYVAPHERDPQLGERYSAEVRLAERAVAYHLQKMDRLPSTSPIGWPHVYTRHVAHWAYEARSSAVGP